MQIIQSKWLLHHIFFQSLKSLLKWKHSEDSLMEAFETQKTQLEHQCCVDVVQVELNW